MKMFDKENLKKIGGYMLPILLLLVIACVYFYPNLEGYQLKQGDITNWKGMSQEIQNYRAEFDEEPYWTNSMFGGMPAYQISARYDSVLRTVRDVLFLGFPRPISYFFLYGLGFYLMLLMFGVKRWLSFLGAVAYAFSTYFIIILEAGHNSKSIAIGAAPLVFGSLYFLFRRDRILGASLLALSAAIEIFMNHYQITYYIGLVCVIFVLFELYQAIKAKLLSDFLKNVGFAAIAGVLAILPNIGQLFGTLDYGKYTTRGSTELTVDAQGNSLEGIKTSGLDKEYATSWSYGLQESLTFLIPNAKGGGSGSVIESREDFNEYSGQEQKALQQIYSGQSQWPQQYLNSYWGNQRFTSGPVYVGAIIFLLAILFLVLSNNRLKWPLLVATLLSLFLGWGKNFMPFTEFFLDFVPGYNKFRTVSMTLVILELTLPLMAVLFLKEVFEKKIELLSDKNKKKFLITGGAVAGLILILLAAPTSLLDFISDIEKSALSNANGAGVQSLIDGVIDIRVSIFRADALRSLFFVLAGFAALYLLATEKLKQTHFIITLGLLFIVDLWPVNKRYLNNEKVNGQYAAWEDPDKNRFPVPPNNADLQIIDTEISQRGLKQAVQNELNEFKQSLDRPRALTNTEIAICKAKVLGFNSNYRVLNLTRSTFNDASTSFYHKSIGGYHGAKLQRYQDVVEWYFSRNLNPNILNMLNTKYIIQNGQQGPQAYPNPDALGNAWFVNDIKWVDTPDDEIQAIAETDLKNIAVVNKKFEGSIKANSVDSLANVSMVSYKVNELNYSCNSTKGGVIVFSEIYYPEGWKAYVDGEEVDIVQANYLLRAIEVPAGKHEIVMSFSPEKVISYANIGYAFGWVLLLLFGATVYLRVIKK